MPPENSAAEGFAFLGGAVAVILRTLLPYFQRCWNRKQVSKAKAGYEGIGDLLETMTDLRRKVGATRVLFLVSRNSGGLPLPGVPVKISVQYESAADDVRLIHGEWQDWPADSAAIEMLTRVAASNGARIEVIRDAMDHGAIRTLYCRDGIGGSALYLIGHVPTGSWMAFLAVEFSEDSEVFENGVIHLDAYRRDILRSAVDEMRRTLRQYHEVIV